MCLSSYRDCESSSPSRDQCFHTLSPSFCDPPSGRCILPGFLKVLQSNLFSLQKMDETRSSFLFPHSPASLSGSSSTSPQLHPMSDADFIAENRKTSTSHGVQAGALKHQPASWESQGLKVLWQGVTRVWGHLQGGAAPVAGRKSGCGRPQALRCCRPFWACKQGANYGVCTPGTASTYSDQAAHKALYNAGALVRGPRAADPQHNVVQSIICKKFRGKLKDCLTACI